MPPYSSSIKPANHNKGIYWYMYLVCRKECELPLPAVPLVKMLTMLGNFTGFFNMDWHHVHSLEIQECKVKCVMYRKFIVNHYEIEIFTKWQNHRRVNFHWRQCSLRYFSPLIRSVWIVLLSRHLLSEITNREKSMSIIYIAI